MAQQSHLDGVIHVLDGSAGTLPQVLVILNYGYDEIAKDREPRGGLLSVAGA